MLIDTHCHLEIMAKKTFNTPLREKDFATIATIISEAEKYDVKKIITVGTSVIESQNCVEIARHFNQVYACVGMHPNDCAQSWRSDLKKITEMIAKEKPGNIVAIGECGIDKHYPGYNIHRQKDAFKMQIEIALKNNLPLVIHNREGGDEILECLDQFKNENVTGVIHCFSENIDWAHEAIGRGFVLGIGGAITYPKNNLLRSVVLNVPLEKIILETDAPFLPPQKFRGQKNHPKFIAEIAKFIAELKETSCEIVAEKTTAAAEKLFKLT